MPTIIIKLLPYILLAALVGGSYIVGHIKGSTACQIKDASKETIAIKKDGETHDKIEFKDIRLSDTDLDKRLNKFLRPSK